LRGLGAVFLSSIIRKNNMKYDFNKVSKESMVEFFNAYTKSGQVRGDSWWNAWNNVREAAEVKLRTRAEVDADIAKVIREYHNEFGLTNISNLAVVWNTVSVPKLKTLVNEETEG
jgi:hypothetical protein